MDIFIDGVLVTHDENMALDYAEKLLQLYASLHPFSTAFIVKDGVKRCYCIVKKRRLCNPAVIKLVEVING